MCQSIPLESLHLTFVLDSYSYCSMNVYSQVSNVLNDNGTANSCNYLDSTKCGYMV